jgi:hypothetical protein
VNRAAACLVVVFSFIAGFGAPASADPAGPTEYLSVIQSIEPATDSIAVRMIGGDSFFEVSQLEPVLIEIVGYQGEPYLRIGPDGVVEENRLSATTYLNQERYGAGDIVPDFVDNDAQPEWIQVGTGGRYAWHDHRSHWMNTQRPPGAEPGDTILEAVIPLRVDGTEVAVSVVSTLEEPASPFPTIGGAAIGLMAAVLLVRRQTVAPAVVATGLALMAGIVEVGSVPPETGPPFTLWFPPALGLAALIGAQVLSSRSSNPLSHPGSLLVAGAQLLLWSLLGRSALSNPILPTDLPWSAHRFIVAMSLVVGTAALLSAAHQLWTMLRGGPVGGPSCPVPVT